MTQTAPPRLPLYDATAEAASGVVIERYSTSFGLASRLLTKDTREHIRNVYALVRVAAEVVDGAATEAGLDTTSPGRSSTSSRRTPSGRWHSASR